MNISREQRAEWQALADAATEGPWTATRMGSIDEIRFDHDANMGSADAAFIAASRQAVPGLLAALEQAEARIATVDAELLYAELHGNAEVWTHNIRRALDGEAGA